MRRILIEKARQKQSVKGGGKLQRRELDDGIAATALPAIDLLALDEALLELKTTNPSKRNWSSFVFSPGCQSMRPPKRSAFLAQPQSGIGFTLGLGCLVRSTATSPHFSPDD